MALAARLPYFLKRLCMHRAGWAGEGSGVPPPLHLHAQHCILLSQEKRIMLVAGRLLLPTTCPASPTESEAQTVPHLQGAGGQEYLRSQLSAREAKPSCLVLGSF